ncbi:hypothetical protein KCV87_09960 [Actinosynnema pretiosum subsp. pretiosum]|uniref:Uncharacterized protein n=1 Tax=Actinosynnema pretiosum subsp. pretiosum TaxID=103721 RepID=A0AA45R646_9PSEU|nr:hypothetical protein APASM_2044 [Actinosynnema pretiosum subsp. pretiosum]QUF06345.1 hypothetical protein KCV87_09960 [Actinosynnema pretiosum subsp. pretiosum]
MAHQKNLIDPSTGARFTQERPYGPVQPVTGADGTPPPSQRSRSWERLVASGYDLQPDD